MAGKYDAVVRALGLEGAAQRQALREIAARWPGALREAQLVAPARLAARATAARRGGQHPAHSMAWWRERGMAAIPLWATLHELLADQLRWRRSRAGPARAEAVAFLADLARHDPVARARWPEDPARLVAAGGARVRPRQAYLWLAQRMGLSLPALHAALFERAGHWDRRPDDPGWTRARDV